MQNISSCGHETLHCCIYSANLPQFSFASGGKLQGNPGGANLQMYVVKQIWSVQKKKQIWSVVNKECSTKKKIPPSEGFAVLLQEVWPAYSLQLSATQVAPKLQRGTLARSCLFWNSTYPMAAAYTYHEPTLTGKCFCRALHWIDGHP